MCRSNVWCMIVFFFFKQKTAYEMRISDWSSDVCSSDLVAGAQRLDQHFFLNMDALRLLVVAIDHGGYAAFTTQRTGGSLASPVAGPGRQSQRIEHRLYPTSMGVHISHFQAPRDREDAGMDKSVVTVVNDRGSCMQK